MSNGHPPGEGTGIVERDTHQLDSHRADGTAIVTIGAAQAGTRPPRPKSLRAAYLEADFVMQVRKSCRLTTRGRYAVTAVLDLALHADDGPVTLADVADRQGISQAYLEQLFRRLKQHGLVVGARGPGGGYRLARTLEDTSVSDIISAVGEGVDATRCGGAGDCQDGEICLTHELLGRTLAADRPVPQAHHVRHAGRAARRPQHRAPAGPEEPDQRPDALIRVRASGHNPSRTASTGATGPDPIGVG